MGDKCIDNRFKIIEKAKKHLLEATNIEGSKDEMACLDRFLFRCWQMRWLKQYDDENETHRDEINKMSNEDLIATIMAKISTMPRFSNISGFTDAGEELVKWLYQKGDKNGQN